MAANRTIAVPVSAPKLNRAGWTYVLVSGLAVLGGSLALIAFALYRTHTTIAQHLHHPDGRGWIVPGLIIVLTAAAMLNAAGRARRRKGLTVTNAIIETALDVFTSPKRGRRR
jgi:hypothetical protein